MTQRPLAEKVLDVVLYAPVGLVVQLGSDVPRVVAERANEVRSRVTVARWVGEMAVRYGRQSIERRWHPQPEAPPPSSPAPRVAAPEPSGEPPFAGYDTLAAAQIVQLLGRLPDSELHMVRDYEATGRARRTILASIDRLLTR